MIFCYFCFYLLYVVVSNRNLFYVCIVNRKCEKSVDAAMHFIYSHKYSINSAEDSSDMN